MIASVLYAFSFEGSGGNPAGVVLDAEKISDSERQRIAMELGFSETAFVEKSHNADFNIRFFTPIDEVDFCGHAIVAVYSLMFQKGILTEGIYTHELQGGIFGVEVRGDGMIFMEQSLPLYESVSHEAVMRCIDNARINPALDPEIVSTGLRDIFVPILSRQELDSLKVDDDVLIALNTETATIGLHAFALESEDSPIVAYARNFAPLYGIPEESATGSSSGALACYLFKNGKLKERNLSLLEFRQGCVMGSPSQIFVSLETDGSEIVRVRVGGKAYLKVG